MDSAPPNGTPSMPAAQQSNSRKAAAGCAQLLMGAAWLGYPLAAYLGLRHGSPRVAAVLLLALLAPNIALRVRAFNRAALGSLTILPLVVASVLAAAALLDSSAFLLFLPVLINLAFLVSFSTTLILPPPMVERFARLQDPDLTPREVAWCGLWTWVWTGFFAVNGLIAGALAWSSCVGWWTAYNGGVSYVVMGTLFGVEYTLRKYRFGRLGSGLLDRQLRRAFAALGKYL